MYKEFAEKNIRFATGSMFLQTLPSLDAGSAQPATLPAAKPASTVTTAAAVVLGVAAATEMSRLA